MKQHREFISQILCCCALPDFIFDTASYLSPLILSLKNHASFFADRRDLFFPA